MTRRRCIHCSLELGAHNRATLEEAGLRPHDWDPGERRSKKSEKVQRFSLWSEERREFYRRYGMMP